MLEKESIVIIRKPWTLFTYDLLVNIMKLIEKKTSNVTKAIEPGLGQLQNLKKKTKTWVGETIVGA